MGYQRPHNWRWLYSAHLERVIDGDTVELMVDLGDHHYVLWGIRLSETGDMEDYIDVFEKRGPEREQGLAATAFVERLFEEKGHDVILETFRDRRGKYRRMLGNIEFLDGSHLVQELRMAGHLKRDYMDPPKSADITA